MLGTIMDQIFSRPEMLAIAGAFVVPIVAIAGFFWHETAKARSKNDLKKTMVLRGMSVEEIERVLGAGGKKAEGQKTED